jgi:hypothetical protein
MPITTAWAFLHMKADQIQKSIWMEKASNIIVFETEFVGVVTKFEVKKKLFNPAMGHRQKYRNRL